MVLAERCFQSADTINRSGQINIKHISGSDPKSSGATIAEGQA